jgi:hypothetical protein
LANADLIYFVDYLRLDCLQDRAKENTGGGAHKSDQGHFDHSGITFFDRGYFGDNFDVGIGASARILIFK